MATYEFTLRDWIAGTAISTISDALYDPTGTYRVCRPAQWSGRVNLQEPAVAQLAPLSTSLAISRDGLEVFHGFTWRVHRKGDRDTASALVTWIDPMIWWTRRVVRDATGAFAKPEFASPITGGELLQQALQNSEDWEAGDPLGTIGCLIGSDTSTVDQTSRLANFPMKISELALMLASTGRCDHWVLPRTDVAGYLGELHVFDRGGNDVSGTVSLDYGTGSFNVAECEHIADAATICNGLWYFYGPKEDEEHWGGGNTTLPINPNVLPNPPQAALSAAILASRDAYGYWQDMRFWDDLDLADSPDRKMFKRMWQLESALRLAPKQMLHAQPEPNTVRPFVDFFLGDRVTVNPAGLGVAGGTQKVYGFEVSPGNDNLERVKIMTSEQEAP